MSDEDVKLWLKESGLSKFSDSLLRNQFDSMSAISRLKMEDLEKIGVNTLGSKRKFLIAIAALQQEPEAADMILETEHPHLAGSVIKKPATLESLLADAAPDIASMKTELVLLRSNVRLREQEISVLRQQTRHEIMEMQEKYTLLQSESQRYRDDIARLTQQKDDNIAWLLNQLRQQETICPHCLKSNIDMPAIEKSVNLLSEVPEDERMIDAEKLDILFHDLDEENTNLEAISEAADQLLQFEKEDAPNRQVAEMVRRRSMEVDVDFFKSNIQQRLFAMLPENKQKESYKLHKMGVVNYQKVLEEQDAEIERIKATDKSYSLMVQNCIEEQHKKAEVHLQVGEFRDKTEYRLKMELALLVGIPTGNLEVPTAEKEKQASAVRRPEFANAQMKILTTLEEVLRTVDTSGDGLMSMEELSVAVKDDKELWEQLHVLGINLSFCPENRMQSDNKLFNDLFQEILDNIVLAVNPDSDGTLTLAELRDMPPNLKTRLENLGINIKI